MSDLGGLLEACTFPEPGTPVSCAVSGGPDSLALLALATAAGCIVTAIYVDHGLRGDGTMVDQAVVEQAAARFGAAFERRLISVPPGPNLEARARDARRAALPRGAATGHTADDQAETVLLNLLRGAGSRGLSAMRPGFEHPILALRRSDTHGLCASLGLSPVHDPMNQEPRFRRNRVRNELLPLLDKLSGRDIVPVLCRQAGLLRDEADFLDSLAAALDPTDSAALRNAPAVVSRRAVRRWIQETSAGRWIQETNARAWSEETNARAWSEDLEPEGPGGYGQPSDGQAAEAYPPSQAAVERVLAVARGYVRATELAGGTRVSRHRGRLVLLAPEGK